MSHLDSNQFKGQLKSDSMLWIKSGSASPARKDTLMLTQSSKSSTDTDRMIEEELDQ